MHVGPTTDEEIKELVDKEPLYSARSSGSRNFLHPESRPGAKLCMASSAHSGFHVRGLLLHRLRLYLERGRCVCCAHSVWDSFVKTAARGLCVRRDLRIPVERPAGGSPGTGCK